MRTTFLFYAKPAEKTRGKCGKFALPRSVEKKPLAISEGICNEAGIVRAEIAYQALKAKDQTKVENYAQLEEARSAYDQLQADAVISAINSIGTITKRSETAIEDAYNQYNALSDSQKEKVSNYSQLEEAQSELIHLYTEPVENKIAPLESLDLKDGEAVEKAEKQINAARLAYQGLNQKYQPHVQNKDVLLSAVAALSERKVSSLISLIDDNLTDVTLESKDTLAQAEKQYKALTEEEQNRVTNAEKLSAAREKYDTLYSEYKVTTLTAFIDERLADITLESQNDIQEAEKQYKKLTEDEKKRVTNADRITEASSEFDELKKAEDERALQEAMRNITV